MGSDRRNEKPQHTLNIPYSYQAAKYPITNAQYELFVKADGYNKRQYWTLPGWCEKEKCEWVGPRYQREPFNLSNHPVVGVSWHEAVAYCHWLTEATRDCGELGEGWQIQLPTGAEWEKAARGTDGRVYPWGNEFDPNKANGRETDIRSTSAVGCFPKGESPYGCHDMAGNVREWCATKRGKLYPYQVENEWTESYLTWPEDRMLRGGSWFEWSDVLRCSYRVGDYPYLDSIDRGFRCFCVPIF